jgi:hypothetical protein
VQAFPGGETGRLSAVFSPAASPAPSPSAPQRSAASPVQVGGKLGQDASTPPAARPASHVTGAKQVQAGYTPPVATGKQAATGGGAPQAVGGKVEAVGGNAVGGKVKPVHVLAA